jgi:hypothetical protein
MRQEGQVPFGKLTTFDAIFSSVGIHNYSSIKFSTNRRELVVRKMRLRYSLLVQCGYPLRRTSAGLLEIVTLKRF